MVNKVSNKAKVKRLIKRLESLIGDSYGNLMNYDEQEEKIIDLKIELLERKIIDLVED